MDRSDRLFDILQLLQAGGVLRAQDVAAQLNVSVRTIYRDMDTLVASGVPVTGSRGVGYRLADVTTLPPLTLTPAELEALNLGLAIVMEAPDPDLRSAALSLAEKLDAALPAEGIAEADQWKFAVSPFADTARGFTFMPTLRAAIRARQKLTLEYHTAQGSSETQVIRPLQMEHIGRIWTVTAWCERTAAHRLFRVDLIRSAEAQPAFFVDEPGKTLADYVQGHRRGAQVTRG